MFSGNERHCVVLFKRRILHNEHILQAFEKYTVQLKWFGNRNYYSIICIMQHSARIILSVRKGESGN